MEKLRGGKERKVDERIYKLLERLIKNGVIEVSPVVDIDRVSYPLIEEVLEVKDFDEVNEFIKLLIKSGMFKYKLIDKVVRCPNCGGFGILVRYHCPYCGSFDINRGSIISHVICGEINSTDVFEKEGKLICPRCGRELVKPGVDYRIIGEVFECSSCKRRFDMPIIMHKCIIDKTTFSYREAKYVPVYLLSLSEEVFESVVKGKYAVSVISSVLRENGFQVSENSTLHGTSGVDQQFDIVALPKNQGSESLCINVTSNISETDIITMFSRIFDVRPAHGVVVSLSDIPERVQKLAKSYGIDIIVAKGIEELRDRVKEYISKLKTKPQ